MLFAKMVAAYKNKSQKTVVRNTVKNENAQQNDTYIYKEVTKKIILRAWGIFFLQQFDIVSPVDDP